MKHYVFLLELNCDTGMFYPESDKNKQNEKNQNQKTKINQKEKICTKLDLKTSREISLEKLKENRKILIDVKAVLLVVPWVRVEFTIQIYLSLYFPFKIFIIILRL
jgi:hypothetical protein